MEDKTVVDQILSHALHMTTAQRCQLLALLQACVEAQEKAAPDGTNIESGMGK